jgi:hypothetical protein
MLWFRFAGIFGVSDISSELTIERTIMSQRRTELQQEIVEALISSKAIDFEAVGKVLSKYGARAARAGDARPTV